MARERGRPRTFDIDFALDRAVEVFWKHGFQDASMQELTDAMGLSKPSLYAAFGDKEALYLKTLERYVALLDGTVAGDEGLIDLPLRVDLDDRPRQVVCYDHGKSAQTRWQVIERTEEQTRIHFFPLTGRTHQLRVHAAHVSGLQCPIVGDNLYGQPAGRLHLHAASIAFTHPVSGEGLELEAECPF